MEVLWCWEINEVFSPSSRPPSRDPSFCKKDKTWIPSQAEDDTQKASDDESIRLDHSFKILNSK